MRMVLPHQARQIRVPENVEECQELSDSNRKQRNRPKSQQNNSTLSAQNKPCQSCQCFHRRQIYMSDRSGANKKIKCKLPFLRAHRSSEFQTAHCLKCKSSSRNRESSAFCVARGNLVVVSSAQHFRRRPERRRPDTRAKCRSCNNLNVGGLSFIVFGVVWFLFYLMKAYTLVKKEAE